MPVTPDCQILAEPGEPVLDSGSWDCGAAACLPGGYTLRRGDSL